MQHKIFARLFALVTLLCLLPAADAALEIEVTAGVRDPVPLAVVPFTAAQGDGGLDVAGVIQNDLEGSGRFKALPREQHAGHPRACRRGGSGGLEERGQ